MDLNNRLITLEMDSSNLYEIFLHEIMKKVDDGKNKEILSAVKYGIKHQFNFEDFIKNRFKKKTYVRLKNGKEVGSDIAKIKVNGKEIPENEFEDEIYERTRLMRGWIWENMTIEKIGDWRESKDGE